MARQPAHGISASVPPRLGTRRRKGMGTGRWWSTAVAVVAVLTFIVVIARSMMSDTEVGVDVTEDFAGDVPLPADERMTAVEFELDADESVLVELDIATMFEASTGDKRGAYANFGIACSSLDNETSSQSATGTQNLRYRDGADLRTQFVYIAEQSGTHRCNANFRAPNWDPDYGDASVDLDATLSASAPAQGLLEEAAPSSADPIVPSAGQTATVIDQTVPIEDDLRWFEASATAHMTTCSIEAGSRDQTDENLCTPELIDREGSSVRIVSAVELVDDGEVCDSFMIHDEETHISHQVHHFVSSTKPERFELDGAPCGDEMRLVQRIENGGPAALVAHRGSSNIIVQAD